MSDGLQIESARGDQPGADFLATFGGLDMTRMRTDGWGNPSTGHGVEGDKNAGVVWMGGTWMWDVLLESLFQYNDLARTIVSALPEWGLRHGFELALEAKDALEAQRVESAVRRKLRELKSHQRELRAAKWGQLYGGGLLLLGAIDGGKTSEPLNLDKLADLRWLRVVAARYVTKATVDTDPLSERLGEGVIYRVNDPRAPGGDQLWHHTRVIVYPGVETTDETKLQKPGGWDLSVLDHVVSRLSLHDSLWDYTGSMMADGSQGVWTIQGLQAASVTGNYSALQARFRAAEQARSIFKSLLLDANGEKFEYVSRQFAGVADLLAQSAVRTAAAAQMPVTVLYGQSPAGLNATGESDIRLWYDRVEQYQEDVLHPGARRIVELILRSKSGPTAGKEPEGWELKYRPVRKATPMEEAELRARQAQIDTAYINNFVLSAVEVAVNRFTSEGWSGETQIDVEARRVALKESLTQLIDNVRQATSARTSVSPAGSLAAPSSTGPSQAPKLPGGE